MKAGEDARKDQHDSKTVPDPPSNSEPTSAPDTTAGQTAPLRDKSDQSGDRSDDRR